MADETRSLLLKINADTAQLVQGMSQVNAQADKTEASFKNLATGVAAGNAIYDTLVGTLSKVKGFFLDSATAADQQDLAVARLTAGIQNVTSAADKNVSALLAQATALQQTTRFSDEAVISAQGILSSFQLNQRAIATLTPHLLDMSEGLAKVSGGLPDLESNAMLVAKALGGEDSAGLATALRRAGVSFTDTQKNILDMGNEQQRLSVISQVLTQNFGGMAVAAGDTAAGGIAKMKNQMNEVQESIGNIEHALTGQFVQAITSLVGGNAMAIASFIVAGTAVVAFGAAVFGVIKLIQSGMLVTTIMAFTNPLILALVAIGALIGTVVFSAMQKLQSKMSDASASAKTLGDGLGSAVPLGAAKGTKAMKDMQDQLAKIDEQMAYSNLNFQQSLADMVKGHQDKGKALKEQLSEENADFLDTQKEEAKSFKESQTSMAKAHDSKVDQIQKQINKQLSMGKNADQQELLSLQEALAEENSEYAKQVLEKQKQYDDDAAKSKAAHDKKTADLQDQINQETAILEKHQSDVATIRQADLLDDIDKLKQSHDQQVKSYEDQKAQVLKTSLETNAGLSKNNQNFLDGLKSQVANAGMENVGANMGKAMGEAFTEALVSTIRDPILNLWKSIKDSASSAWQWLKAAFGNTSDADAFLRALNTPAPAGGFGGSGASIGPEHRAAGGPVTAGEEYFVNEEGLEMFVPGQNGTILSHDKTMDYLRQSGGTTQKTENNVTNFNFSLTFQIGMYAGMPVEKRQIATDLWRELQRVATTNGVILPNIGVTTQ